MVKKKISGRRKWDTYYKIIIFLEIGELIYSELFYPKRF